MNLKFKTAICKFTQNGGECPYAEKCLFAHCEKELKRPKDVETNPILCNEPIGGVGSRKLS